MRTHLPVTQAMAEMIGLRPDHFCWLFGADRCLPWFEAEYSASAEILLIASIS